MTAGVLSELGLTFGSTVGPSKANPKGFFENERVRTQVKRFIIDSNGDPEGQRLLPAPGEVSPDIVRSSILNALDGNNAYKEAKICLLWDSWTQAFPDSLYVLVRRPVDDIVTSCLNTSFMKGRSGREAWTSWAQHYIDAIEQIKSHVEFIEVWPDGTPDVFEPVATFAGLEFNKEKVGRFVDPALWNRNTRKARKPKNTKKSGMSRSTGGSRRQKKN